MQAVGVATITFPAVFAARNWRRSQNSVFG